MAWTAPQVFTVGQVVGAADMNEISDNFSYLKGTAGLVAIDAGITASGVITATAGFVNGGPLSGCVLGGPLSGNTHVTVSGIVTAGAGFVTPTHISSKGNVTMSGMVQAGAGITTPTHISSRGNVTTSGMVVAGAGIITATHISTTGNVDMQSGKTVDGVDVSVHATDRQSSHGVACTGSAQIACANCDMYQGDGTPNKAIPHSLGRMPYVVLIQTVASGYYTASIFGAAPTQMYYQSASVFGSGGTVTTMDDTNFYVGQSGRYAQSMNLSGQGYTWTAIG
jgi:hypothetical protein